MSFSSLLRSYVKSWLSRKKNQPIRTRRSSQRLVVEMLEERTVMSALPPAVVGSIAATMSTGPSNTSPTVVVDPLDPTKIVEVHATHPAANANAWDVSGNYSTDQGRTWHAFLAAVPLTDPSTPNGLPFAQIVDPSVAFDRNHHFYVVSAEENAALTSGAIVLQRFNFAGTAPLADLTLGHQDPLSNGFLSRWQQRDLSMVWPGSGGQSSFGH